MSRLKLPKWHFRLFRGRPWYAKVGVAAALIVLSIVLYLGAVDINLFGLFGMSPSMETIKTARPLQASEVYSADGVLIGKLFNENRTPVTYDEVSPHFWNALIDTEDERFYSHHGVDIPALFAACRDNISRSSRRGASTITQQLAKNLFRVRTLYSTGALGKIPGLGIFVMKSKEWVTAMKLEWNFTKDEILTMYANTVDFGSQAYGIKTACATYFGTTPAELTVEQAALLVGMLKATTAYSPLTNAEASRQRRNVVMANMVSHGHLTQADYDSLAAMPIRLNYNVEHVSDGQAQYFRAAIEENVTEWCRRNGIDAYGDGLKIYTTIDMRMQKYAEDAVRHQMRTIQQQFDEHWQGMNPWRDDNNREISGFIERQARRLPVYKELARQYPGQPDSIWQQLSTPHDVTLFSYDGPVTRHVSTLDSLRYMLRFMHCGMMAMEPHTGNIKAWVGDIDYGAWKYDKVLAHRQPGSTFKLFVYTAAMNAGMTPCKPYLDREYNIGGTWTPHNASGSVSDCIIPLRSAFARSVNTIAARLAEEVGVDNVIRTAHNMGVKSQLEQTPAIALGACDVTLFEMVNAYATVAADGMRREPVFVTRILDREGNEIYRAKDEPHEAIPYRSAYFMQQMLKGVLNGTGAALKQYVADFTDTEFGAKTGTSSNYADGWFMAVSPRLVCGAWVGGEYRSIHFRTGQLGQGSRTALPVCGRFLRSVLSDGAFKEYRTLFPPCRNDDIRREQYECDFRIPQIPIVSTNDSTEQAEGF